jgi:signal transduction histidine kinase
MVFRRLGSRPLVWVSSILYLAVLASGVYYDAAGLRPGMSGGLPTAGFVGVMLFLLALEQVERRRFGHRPPWRLAIGLLALRLVLFTAVVALDCSGFSRSLFLLVPFTAYFSLGRRVSYGLAVLLLAAAVLRVSLVPAGWRDSGQVSDLLMSFIGLVFAVSMATVAAEEEASRARAERFAERVADLAAATERNRLARDIHDSLGHHLTAIVVQLEKADTFRVLDPAASQQALLDARRSTRYALQDVRQSVGALREGTGFCLSTALADLVEGLHDSGLAVDLDIDGDENAFAGPSLIALYRAAQEGLTNVRKHAGADRVTMSVSLTETGGQLVVADNGRGLRTDRMAASSTNGGPVNSGAAAGGSGYGLVGMRERLELIGGTLRVQTTPGQGTRLTVTVPATVSASAPWSTAPGSIVDTS